MKVTIWEGALPTAGVSSAIASRGNGCYLREVRVLDLLLAFGYDSCQIDRPITKTFLDLLLVLGRESSEVGRRESIFKRRQF
jgi:hypothetical protein